MEAAICKGLNGCHVEAFVLLTPKSIGSWPHGAVTQQASISIVVSFDCMLPFDSSLVGTSFEMEDGSGSFQVDWWSVAIMPCEVGGACTACWC